MSDVTDAVGAGEQFESGGMVCCLSPISPGLRAKFSQWCKIKAYRELREAKEYLDEDEHRERAVRLDEEMTAGAYNWGSPLGTDVAGPALRAVLRTPEGQLRLTGLLLERWAAKQSPPVALDPEAVQAIVSGADALAYAGALRRALGLPPPAEEQAPNA